MYFQVISTNSVKFIYIPIRPSRRDPELDELEDTE